MSRKLRNYYQERSLTKPRKEQVPPPKPPQTLKIRDIEGSCETYVKLKKVEKLLRKYGFLNNKYLYKRNNTYYFSIKIGNQVLKKSLHSDNFLISNILKYKGICLPYIFK